MRFSKYEAAVKAVARALCDVNASEGETLAALGYISSGLLAGFPAEKRREAVELFVSGIYATTTGPDEKPTFGFGVRH